MPFCGVYTDFEGEPPQPLKIIYIYTSISMPLRSVNVNLPSVPTVAFSTSSSQSFPSKALVTISSLLIVRISPSSSSLRDNLSACYYNNIWSYNTMTSQPWFTRTCYLGYNESSDWTNVSLLGASGPYIRQLSMLSL